MAHLVIEVTSAWLALAVITGVALGALIRSAERLHEEEVLEAIFSYLATCQTLTLAHESKSQGTSA
jgi:hypothetical protein